MGTIEKKVHELQELSRQQKKINEIKQDIANILGNADMDEKKKIAEQMSKMEYENMNQARNLQFIVPNLVKELYEHEGPKWEFILPKKTIEKKETEPTPETKEETSTPVQAEKKDEKKYTENKKEKQTAPQEKKEYKETKNEEKATEKIQWVNKVAEKIQVIPWFEIQKPVIETEEIKEEKTVEPVIEPTIKPAIEPVVEPVIEQPAEPIVEPEMEAVAEPIIVQQPGKIQPETIEQKTEPTPEKKKGKKKKSFKLINLLGIKTRKQKIEIQQEKIAKIQEEKRKLRQEAWNILENKIKNLSESSQELLKSGIDIGEIPAKDIDAQVPQTERESFNNYAKKLMIKIKE